jgi:cell shape-determining protein MreD
MTRAEAIAHLNRLRPLIPIIVVVAVIVAAAVFLPTRGAAAVAGVVLGLAAGFYLVQVAGAGTRTALMWIGATVSADAAYAKLNDLQSTTLANALVRVVDSILKLAEPLTRGVALAVDPRARVASVAPEFVWALILTLVVYLAATLSVRPSRL